MFLVLLLVSLSSAEFLTPVPDHERFTLPDLCQEDTVLSCTLVHLDLASLQGSTLVFNGTTFTLLDQPGNNTFTFSTEDGDEATLTVDNELGAVWGNARMINGGDFVIEPSLDNCVGCHVVIEEDIGAFPHDHVVVSPSFEETRSRKPAWPELGDLLKKGRSDKTTMVTYTIKIYYTPELLKSYGNDKAMLKTMAEQVVGETNQGYINSKIPLRAVLHCMEETTVPEAKINEIGIFHKYKGGGNGLRGSADAAALLILKHKKYCGVAWIPSAPYDKLQFHLFRDFMVSITVLNCGLGGTYTFGHELSHNMGNDHDKYNRNRKIPFARGYHIPGTDVRTIMAYVRPKKFGGGYRNQINYYSNPNVKFKGIPTGVEGEANSARMIRENRFPMADDDGVDSVNGDVGVDGDQ